MLGRMGSMGRGIGRAGGAGGETAVVVSTAGQAIGLLLTLTKAS